MKKVIVKKEAKKPAKPAKPAKTVKKVVSKPVAKKTVKATPKKSIAKKPIAKKAVEKKEVKKYLPKVVNVRLRLYEPNFVFMKSIAKENKIDMKDLVNVLLNVFVTSK